VGYIDTFY